MANIERWQGRRWRARWRDPSGRTMSRVFDRKVDAQRHLTGIEHAKLTHTYTDPSAGKVTFRAFAEQWRSWQVHRSGTASSVEQQLGLHVYQHIGGRPIGAIRPGEIQAMVQRLGTRLAPSTVEVIYGRVVAVFRAAILDRVIAVSPCVAVRRPSGLPSSTLRVLTSEQVVAMADAVPERYRALVITGAGTGLRPGELFGLEVDRVDFLRRVVRVDQQLGRVPSGGVGLVPPKRLRAIGRCRCRQPWPTHWPRT